MELVCQNLRFLRQNIQEARSSLAGKVGISDYDASSHLEHSELCTDEVLQRYCHLYNNTGVASDIYGRLTPERLRSEDLANQWNETFGPTGGYGRRPYRKP